MLQISIVDSLVSLCTREAHATVFVLFNFISPVQTHWGKYFFWNALENNSIESIKYKHEGISIKLHWNCSWKCNCTDSYFIARNPRAVTRYIVELHRFYSKWYQECVRRLEGVGQPPSCMQLGRFSFPSWRNLDFDLFFDFYFILNSEVGGGVLCCLFSEEHLWKQCLLQWTWSFSFFSLSATFTTSSYEKIEL